MMEAPQRIVLVDYLDTPLAEAQLMPREPGEASDDASGVYLVVCTNQAKFTNAPRVELGAVVMENGSWDMHDSRTVDRVAITRKERKRFLRKGLPIVTNGDGWAAVAVCPCCIDKLRPQPRTSDWIAGWKSTPSPYPEEKHRRELLDRAKSDPSLRPLMERFPPLCLVRIKPGVSMWLLGPGEWGFVAEYGDPYATGDHQCPNPGCLQKHSDRSDTGLIVVCIPKPKPLPNGGRMADKAVCRADELEVVCYRQGLTPEFVRETFSPN